LAAATGRNQNRPARLAYEYDMLTNMATFNRFMFAGHAVGAAARFHRLDDTSVNEVVPAQGAVVLASTGGRSDARAAGFRYDVSYPPQRWTGALNPRATSRCVVSTCWTSYTSIPFRPITFDDEPLTYTGSQEQLAEFYRTRHEQYRNHHGWRFHTTPDGKELADDHGYHRISLVSGIELSGRKTRSSPSKSRDTRFIGRASAE
jgi:hypothetical protein